VAPSFVISRLVAVLVALAAHPFAVASQDSNIDLAALTVPAQGLPKDCRLEEAAARKPGEPRVRRPLLAPVNPWIGRDGRMLVALRKHIDGGFMIPDAPPPSPAEVADMERHWIADIVEGYYAAYTLGENQRVEVAALKFRDATLVPRPRGFAAVPERPGTRRLVRGPVLIDLRASQPTECAQAVAAHVAR
jgi:hypothetical protein